MSEVKPLFFVSAHRKPQEKTTSGKGGGNPREDPVAIMCPKAITITKSAGIAIGTVTRVSDNSGQVSPHRIG
jgi:hypothetical protein